MSLSEKMDNESPLLLVPLPVLIEILKYCDIRSLGRLSQTCSVLRNFIQMEKSIWESHSQRCLVTNQLYKSFKKKSFSILSPKEKCRIQHNWISELYRESFIWQVPRKKKYLKIRPWIQLERNKLYYTTHNTLEFAERCGPGVFSKRSEYSHFDGHTEDISKFTCTDQHVISGGRDRLICVWDKTTLKPLFKAVNGGYESEVNSVACFNEIVVSGSRDHTVKVWSSLPHLVYRYAIDALDNVWDVTTLNDGRFIAVGTGSKNKAHPLLLYDLETGSLVSSLGFKKFRDGDGIFHIFPESQNEIYTGSYDSIIHLWDVRCPNVWVKKWDEPNDSAVFCIDSDKSFTFVCGTARHGIVRLWDKRASSDIRAFYMGKRTLHHRVQTPVYSVAFDAQILCAGLDDCISYCDFS